jgi:hypothetical protein
MPHSPMTLATVGLILSPGSVPAERTRTSLGVVMEQGAGRLAAARVVYTDEQHFGNVVHQAPLLQETWPLLVGGERSNSSNHSCQEIAGPRKFR